MGQFMMENPIDPKPYIVTEDNYIREIWSTPSGARLTATLPKAKTLDACSINRISLEYVVDWEDRHRRDGGYSGGQYAMLRTHSD